MSRPYKRPLSWQVRSERLRHQGSGPE
jgi:hypothetical protein